MPTRRYPLNRGEPKRLEITYPPDLAPLAIRLDGNPVGVIQTRQELESGKSFPLGDSSTLEVQLTWRGLSRKSVVLVLRNGRPVPGSPSSPDFKLGEALQVLFLFGGMVLLFSLGITIFALSAASGLPAVGIGALIYGARALVLGYFVRRRSTVALGLAIGLEGLTAGLVGLYLVLTLAALLARAPFVDPFDAAVGSFGIGWFLLSLVATVYLWRGFDAIRKIQAETRGETVQVGNQ